MRYRGERAHTGNMFFAGENPPAAAVIDYWIRDAGTEATITVLDAQGTQVATVAASGARGVNRALWDLRHALPGAAPGPASPAGGFGRRPQGALVVPGLYTVRLTAGGVTSEQVVRVKEDPRLDVDPLIRAQWTRTLQEITGTLVQAQDLARAAAQAARRLQAGEARAPGATVTKVQDLDREFGELVSRLSGLRNDAEDWVGPLTSDQASQKAFFEQMLGMLRGEWQAIQGRIRE